MGALIGALLGGALGVLNAQIISRVVIRALEATDRSQTETEKADYRARIRLFWLIVHVSFMAGGLAVGYGLGGWLFG